MKNLEGNRNYIFSNRDVYKIIIPLIIEQFLAMFVGLVDSVMISSVGEAAISSVSIVDSINFLIFTLLTAIATGGAVVSGQYLGKKDNQQANNAANQLIITVFIISIILTAFILISKDVVLKIMFSSVSEQVMNYSQKYLMITAFSIPFMALYNGAAALFRTMADSKTPMIISFIMNGINIVGNAVLIYGLHWGIEGAAIPTLISRVIAAVIIIILLAKSKYSLHLSIPFSFKLESKMVKKILSIGIPNGIENSMFQFGKIIVVSLVASFGTSAITANAVGNSIGVFQILPGIAISTATIPIISRCYGAGDDKQVIYYSKKLLKLSIIFNLIINIVLALCIPLILKMYNLTSETRSLTVFVLIFSGGVSSLLWSQSFMLPNVFRATGDVKYPMVVSIISMWIWRVGGSFLFGSIFGLGLIGIWFGMSIDWIFRGVLFIRRYRSKVWRNSLIDISQVNY